MEMKSRSKPISNPKPKPEPIPPTEVLTKDSPRPYKCVARHPTPYLCRPVASVPKFLIIREIMLETAFYSPSSDQFKVLIILRNL